MKISNSITDENTFRAALAERGKSDVFAGVRACSWADFRALPMPDRTMEEWRFAKLSDVSFDGFSLPGEVSAETAAALVARSDKIAEPAGTLVFADDRLVACSLSDEAARAGVTFAPFSRLAPEAFEEIRGLVFASGGGVCSEKIAALHRAYAFGGAYLLRVPAGVKIEKPFAVYNWSVAKKGATFPYALVVAEENASARVADFYLSADADGGGLVVSRTEIFAKAGADVARRDVQALAAAARFYRMEWTHARENANVRGVAISLGAARARTTTELRLEGRGANAELFSLAVANADQEIDQRTIQRHLAPGAGSHLLFKNALLDRARTIFGGNIVVDKTAQGTDAVQSCRNLILSEDAEAHSLPGLEIDANDVRCSHGATTGTLDPEQLFYLLQRGLPLEEARTLLIHGFMEEIVARIEDVSLADAVRGLVRAKLVA